MLTSDQKTTNAYKYCLTIAKGHYENFPVASHLLAKKLRYPISAVYTFARTADDFADEGNISQQDRFIALDDYTSELNNIKNSLERYQQNKESRFFHHSDNLLFIALADTIHQFKIPIELFHDLLTAFKKDIITSRYQTFNEVLAYCRLSANPVGRIMLYLNKSATQANLLNSDAICTGLQLINFYQDIAQDIDENDRLYLPLEELAQYNLSVSDIRNHINNHNTKAFFTFQLQRTIKLYESGQPLFAQLTGRFAIEIRMIYRGGQLVLEKLAQNNTSIYQRPRLNRIDKLKIIWHSFFS